MVKKNSSTFVRILSFNRTSKPVNGIRVYATVQSRTRGARLNHTVSKHGRTWRCSCESNSLAGRTCAHIHRIRVKAEGR